jgi:hypothetical protein
MLHRNLENSSYCKNYAESNGCLENGGISDVQFIDGLEFSQSVCDLGLPSLCVVCLVRKLRRVGDKLQVCLCFVRSVLLREVFRKLRRVCLF